jgi:hypothetical protein
MHRLTEARAFGKAGRAIEVADRLAFAAKYGVLGQQGWESLMQLADEVITRTDRYFSPGWKFDRREGAFPAGDFLQFARKVNPKDIAEAMIEIDTGKTLDDPRNVKGMVSQRFLRENYGRLFFRGESVSLTGRSPQFGIYRGIIAASEDIQVTSAINSVIIAGGDVRKVERLMNCIVICDGDLELLNASQVSGIVFVRGKVTCKEGRIRNCLVRSGYTLRLPGGPMPNEKTIDVRDGTPDPLAFVKFFELTDVGLATEDVPPLAKSDTTSVRLKDVRKDSPFASGLRAGDMVIAIDEKKTPTTEVFRRVLRRTLAEGGPIITFTVRRAGKTLDVPLPVKD